MNLARHPGSTWRRLRWLWLLVGAMLPRADAYVLDGYHWQSGQPIVMNLQLSPIGYTLTDGSTSYNQVAQAAMDVWNPYLGSGVQFEAAYGQFTPAQRDGANSVYFSTTVDGEEIGDDTLAVTVSYFSKTTHIKDEADVVVSDYKSFNSYRGPLRHDGVYDLRRTLIHEFGHVLGLEHVDQNAQSIMTPVVTDIDTLQADDIAGAAAIYGPPTPVVPVVNSTLSSGAVVGQPFQYQIGAANYPVSYRADGLPAGLSLDASTGLISGTPTAAGTYNVTIGATNAAGTGTATLVLTFDATPAITSSPGPLALYVGYPFSYQITASGEPTSFSALNLPAGLTLDTTTGYISGTPTVSGSFNVAISAANRFASSTSPLTLQVGLDAALTILQRSDDNGGKGLKALILGSDGNLYGVTQWGGPNGAGTLFELTPDGVMTTLHSFSPAEGNPCALVQGRDGNFYGATDIDESASYGALFKSTPDGTTTLLCRFVGLHGTLPQTTVAQGADGNLYGTISYPGTVGISDLAGTVFEFSLENGTMTTLHQFSGPDGYAPSGLVQGRDGNFYGTTNTTTNYGYGTVFRVTPDGVFTTVHSFVEADGIWPNAPLTSGSDGNLYGTTIQGGSGDEMGGGGTVFRLTADGTLTVLADFPHLDPLSSTAPLLQGLDGNFYGLAGFGSLGGPTTVNGTLFKITPTGTLTTLDTLEDFEGIAPAVALVQDKAGVFYGALGGNQLGAWVIFKRVPVAPPIPVVLPNVVLSATTPKATAGSGEQAVFTVTLSAPQSTDTAVHYTVNGTGINGTDYVLLSGTKTIKAGRTSKKIKVVPQGDLGGARKKTVKLQLAPGDGYTVGTAGAVKVSILAAP